MAEFRMPSLGADMDEGTLVSWLVGVGDHVDRGDVVAEVDTEKSVIEVETFDTGTVRELLVHEGERVPVGTPLALIAEDAMAAGPSRRTAATATRTRPAAKAKARTAAKAKTSTTTSAKPAAKATAGTKPVVAATAAATTAAPSALVRGGARVAASPLARRHAAALGVDLATVAGTGPGGAVTTSDVEAAAHAVADVTPPVPVERPVEAEPAPVVVDEPAPVAPVLPRSGADRQASMRHAVAEAMARSKREIPHYYLATDVDMTRANRWLEAHNASVPVTERVLVAALQLKATALALRAVPELNGHWVDGERRPAEHVHLGVAIALRGGGLVAPAIHDADLLPLPDVMAALHDLVKRVRAGRVRSSEYADPTATVTNLGDQGVDTVYPVINPPQLAMVGFGRVRERPWAVDGMLAVRPVLTVTLAADHRATDGHRGATFLAALDDLLQRPDDL